MTLICEAQRPRSLFDRFNDRPRLLQEIAWIALVCGGAVLILTSLVIDYFGLVYIQFFGPKQIAGLVAGLAAIAVGVVVQSRAEPRKIAEILKFWAVAVQVALLAYVIKLYNLENSAFYDFVVPVILCGFIIHHYLPPTLRMPFFFLMSCAGIYGVLGAANPTMALGLMGAGLALFGVCHLPIALSARVGLLVVIALALARLRLEYIETSWAAAMLPLLASMFMFRIAIYLYDRHNNKGPTSIWTGLSYFFMLPNIVFPFFPVVDYTTFGRTRYNDDAHRIYQRGANMIARAVVQLLLYRAVNYYFVLPPEEVVGSGTFLQFVVANYALYLRISGLFHLVVGLLLLFGFNLPETHFKYFLAHSFVDYWRRINIYWKDFMQKMVFNPTYMRLKRGGISHMTSIVIAILAVFLATWALHAYQWFWLRGAVDLRIEDMMFWGILAVFLVVQTVRESRQEQTVASPGKLSPLTVQILLALRTICTFLTICVLWSLWTSDSLSEWLQMWAASGLVPALAGDTEASGVDWVVTIAAIATMALMAAVATGFFIGAAPPSRSSGAQRQRERGVVRNEDFYRSAAMTAVLGILLVLAPALTALIGQGAQKIAHDIRETRLNARDQALLERGYYQQLTNVNKMNSQLWQIFMNDQSAAPFSLSRGERKRADYLSYELIPSSSFLVHDVQFDTNRWGMRDDDYDLAKKADTYRIALIGSSRAVGWGVNVEDRYESILEKRLNREQTGGAIHNYEILNFGVVGYVPEQELITLETKAIKFKPDTILYEAGRRDQIVDFEAAMFKKGLKSPYPFVDEILRKAGVHRKMSVEQIMRLLSPHRFEILGAVYNRITAVARAHGAKPVWMYVPQPVQGEYFRRKRDRDQMKKLAKKAGFTIIDLDGVYDSEDPHTLIIAQSDFHPNGKGHQLIFERLYGRVAALLAGKSTITQR